MENNSTLNPATLMDPMIRLVAWIAQLFMAQLTVLVVDESQNALGEIAIYDLMGNQRGITNRLTGACRCRRLDQITLYHSDGQQLLIWSEKLEDFVPMLEVPAAARRITVKAKRP